MSVAARILAILEDAGFYDPVLFETDDEQVGAVREFVAKAADWKAESERLDALSIKMSERIDKLTRDNETLRDQLASQIAGDKKKATTDGGAYC